MLTDRYELLGELGRGGMATVYLARQLDLNRLVALKRLDALADGSGTRVRRFVREARLAASLSHPNIVTIHDSFAIDGAPYIAMEYVPGGTLRELIVGLSLEQIAGVLDGVLDGLAHAERRHIVHRDLKPENLMVTAEGAVKIADFGIAKATSAAQDDDGPLTTVGVALGTPAYMAPEQAMAHEPTPRTDLYAVGIIAFELLTGCVPFRDPDSSVGLLLQHVNDTPPTVAERRPDVDVALSDWVACLLEKEPAARPDDATSARVALEDIVLRLRGPRWRRESPLPYFAADVPTDPTVALGGTAPGTVASEGTGHTTQARTDPVRRPPPASVTPAEPSPPVTGKVRTSRFGRRAVVLLAIGGAAAAVMFAGARHLGNGGPRLPAGSLATYASPDAARPEAGAARRVNDAPAVTAETTPVPQAGAAVAGPSVATAATPAAPVDTVRIQDAERQAARIGEEAQDTEGDGDEALTQQLRDAQYAYLDAVNAGTGGDAPAFAAALQHADELARSAMARLDADN